MVNPIDADQLAAAIVSLSERSHDERERLGARAHSFAQQYFSPESLITILSELYVVE